MELTKRILEILENSGLTPSEFADKIEVQRSAISHITSGRNKPSLEFLLKIKKAFPEIDTDWLLFGTPKNEEIVEIPESNSTESKEIEAMAVSNFNSPTLFDLDEIANSTEEDHKKIHHETPKISHENEKKNQKEIERVIIFYTDGTFDDYLKHDS